MIGDEAIARAAELWPIDPIAAALDVAPGELERYGEHVAKLVLPRLPRRDARGKLVLVTAITPTSRGAGKTVVAIGLGQALGALGLRGAVCLREPSLGPLFGIKGGAAGGGHAQVVPMDRINLHFTGDLHAVTSAHNLLSALVDNHAHHGSALDLDPEALAWPRVLDLCDRQLRHCEVGLGSKADGFPHRTRFDITAASEVMAVLALSESQSDLEARLARIVVAHDRAGRPRTAGETGAVGAMGVLLSRALWPNLVQTLEHTPALVHCGPFANIAHGASSVLATRIALERCEYVVTEAGFGADLGAEKFLQLKCRIAGLWPAAAVVVATCRDLRYHGGASEDAMTSHAPAQLAEGLANLRVHVENLHKLGLACVVALNRHPGDGDDEVARVRGACEALGCRFAVVDAFGRGGEGALELAREVRGLADEAAPEPRFLYSLDAPLRAKVEAVAREMYRADGVDYHDEAAAQLDALEAEGFGALPVCVAKTPLSLSDRPSARGVPTGWRLRVRAARVSAGAGFVVVETGKVVTMPGMPPESAALRIALGRDGYPTGLG